MNRVPPATTFGCRTLAEIEVAGETRRRREMRLARPIAVILFSIAGIGILKPRTSIVASFVNRQNHLGQERRLRTGQIIRPIRIEDLAIFSYLVQQGLSAMSRARSSKWIAQQNRPG